MSSMHKPGDLAVSVQHLGLVYRTTIDKKASLPTRIKSLGRGTKQTRIVNALDDVNLDIDYGSVLGVVGANGAGKSTLMRVVSGILPPTKGRVEVYGKVSTFSRWLAYVEPYFSAGFGLAKTETNSYLAAYPGIGLRTFFTEWFSMRLEFRDYIYNEKKRDGTTAMSQAR